VPEVQSHDRPNVVLIYTDDQDPDWVGAYGGDVLTPNIDSLADDGVRFDRYYASSPVCSPSRYSALTGRYASRSDRFQEEFPPGGPVNVGWEPGIRGESSTLPSVISDSGYTTGLVGKFHQGIDEEEFEPIPDDADPTDPAVEARLEQNYQTVIDIVESHGFDHAASVYEGNVAGMELPDELTHQNMDWVTQGAVDFIENNQSDPFFLFMAPTLMHSPRGEDQIRSDPRATPRGYLDEAPDVQPSRESIRRRTDEAEIDGPVDATWLDDGVGAVLDTLEECGLAEDTLVIFTSDHGDIEGKFSTYDRGARQPCLARWPAVLDAQDPVTDLVSNVDLAPTLFDLVGVDPGADYTVDGQSFAPVLTGEGEYERESVFLEITTERAVVTDDNWKYIAVRYPPEIQERVDDGERFNHWCVRDDENVHHTFGADEYYPAYFDQDQLYNLDTDPEEQNNLAHDPDYADRLAMMQDLLREYSADLPHEFGEFTD
jgi:arylsulfatase A-like enzyme